jgi:hypothetical protein
MAEIYIGETPKKQLRFVCAQPASEYYAWQVDVMLNNFRKQGINLNQVDIVCWKIDGVIPESWNKLANHYPARFFFYDDTRETRHYISSIRPNILKQHWKQYPELVNDAIFYHDCDIVFTKPPTEWITDIMIGDKKWYGSDTRFYIAHSYIKSKGEDVLDKMCEIVGIDKFEVEQNELAAIGAQYLMKNIDYEYWNKVEKDCEILFKDITELNNKKKEENPNYHELQIWCSDMWAVLWNGWLRGNQTIVHDNFKFTWATESSDDWEKNNIYHNAGVVNNKVNLFYKADYMESYPYNVTLELLTNTASYRYWLEICETAKQTPLV